MEWLTSPEIWVAFFTLTALEIVLGIDNIIMISILVSRMPKHMQPRTRIFGLALAMVTRIMLLLSITWVMRLTADLFVVFGQGISGRDLILFFGGLFLLWKSSQEIYHGLEGEDECRGAQRRRWQVLLHHHPDRHHRHRVLAGLGDHRCGHGFPRTGDDRRHRRGRAGDDAVRRRHQQFHRQTPVAEDARAVVPDRGRYCTDR